MAQQLKIPYDLNQDNINRLQQNLKDILQLLEAEGAKRVCIRLNRSGTDKPSPIHIETVEDHQKREQRKKLSRGALEETCWSEVEPGACRRWDDNPSVVYNETVRDPKGSIKERDWSKDFLEKSQSARGLALKSGVKHQRYIAIRVEEKGGIRSVGLLSVGFVEDPIGCMANVAKTIRFWAQDPASDLVKHLRNTFELGGPTFPP